MNNYENEVTRKSDFSTKMEDGGGRCSLVYQKSFEIRGSNKIFEEDEEEDEDAARDRKNSIIKHLEYQKIRSSSSTVK